MLFSMKFRTLSVVIHPKSVHNGPSPVIQALTALGVKIYAYFNDLLIVGSSESEVCHFLYVMVQYMVNAWASIPTVELVST